MAAKLQLESGDGNLQLSDGSFLELQGDGAAETWANKQRATARPLIALRSGGLLMLRNGSFLRCGHGVPYSWRDDTKQSNKWTNKS